MKFEHSPARRRLGGLLAALALVATPVVAQDSGTPFEINPGLNDAWYFPPTTGQGFLVNVFPGIEQVFLAWFTYDTERPPADATAILGEPGHRWLTALGPYDGDTTVMAVNLTEGGTFDAPLPDPDNANTTIGTITVVWSDCNTAELTYDFLGLTGTIPIQRVAVDNVALCEAFLSENPPLR